MDTTSTGRESFSKQKGVTLCSIMNPENLIYIINLYSPTGIIYDRLAGRGTRAIIGTKIGLIYRGVELRLEKVEAIQERLKANDVDPEPTQVICAG